MRCVNLVKCECAVVVSLKNVGCYEHNEMPLLLFPLYVLICKKEKSENE